MAKDAKREKAGAAVDRLGPVGRVLDAVGRSRLTYGEPVQAGGRTVIPVTRVRATGGHGWGRGQDADGGEGGGGGWGGTFDAQPVGFIDMGPEGTTYHEIPDPDRLGRNLKAGAAALTAVLGGLAGARRLTAGRRVPRRRALTR